MVSNMMRVVLAAVPLALGACEASGSMAVPVSAAGASSGTGSGTAPEAKPAAATPKPPPLPYQAGQHKPYGIAVDGDHVYWANHDDHTIMKAPKAGGPAVKLGALPAPVGGDHVALDDQFVYVSAYPDHGSADLPASKIVRVPKAGGAVTELVTGIISAGALAVDATSIYWHDEAQTIFKAPKAGGPKQTLATLNMPQGDILLDDAALYFIGTEKVAALKLAKTGGAVTTLVPSTNSRTIALDAQFVYFIRDSSVEKVPKAGGAPTPVGKAPEAMVLVAAKDAIYGTHRGKTDIWKISLSAPGGASQTVVPMHPGAWGLAVDDTSVYWTDGDKLVGKAPR